MSAAKKEKKRQLVAKRKKDHPNEHFYIEDDQTFRQYFDAGAALTAGQFVMLDSAGKIAPLEADGYPIGVFVSEEDGVAEVTIKGIVKANVNNLRGIQSGYVLSHCHSAGRMHVIKPKGAAPVRGICMESAPSSATIDVLLF